MRKSSEEWGGTSHSSTEDPTPRGLQGAVLDLVHDLVGVVQSVIGLLERLGPDSSRNAKGDSAERMGSEKPCAHRSSNAHHEGPHSGDSKLHKGHGDTSHRSTEDSMPRWLQGLMDLVQSVIGLLGQLIPDSSSNSEGSRAGRTDAAKPSNAYGADPSSSVGKSALPIEGPANQHRMTDGQKQTYEAYDKEITKLQQNGEISDNVADRARVALMFEGGDSLHGPQDKSKDGTSAQNYSAFNYSEAAVAAYAPERLGDMAKGNNSPEAAVGVFTAALTGAEKAEQAGVVGAQADVLNRHRGGESKQRAGEFSADTDRIMSHYNVQEAGQAGYRLSYDRAAI